MRNTHPAPYYFSDAALASAGYSKTPGNNAPLHLAIVTETYDPEVNGVAMTLGRIVNGLIAQGHTVQLHRPRQLHEPASCHAVHHKATPNLKEFLYAGLPIPGYAGLRFGVPAQRRLMEHWRTSRPDMVHVVTEGPLGLSAVSCARAMHLPISSSFHTNFQSYSKHYGVGLLHRSIDRYLRNLHNKTLATMVPTQAMQQELHLRGYKNTKIVSRGVEIDLFSPAKRSESLRQEWGVRDHDLVLMHVGRIAKEKNIAVLIAAYRAILAKHASTKLVLVGDGPLRKALEQSCPEAIFAGVQKHESLARYYASADVFLFPSVTETFGNVVTEALASGLAVVSFARAAALELIRHNDSGVLATQEDQAHFVEASLNMVSNMAAMHNMRQAAVASVAHLRWSAVVDSFVRTLEDAKENHRQKYYPAIGERLATPLRLSSA